MADEDKNEETVSLTADIVSAYVSNNPVPSTELPALISDVHKSLSGLASGGSGKPAEPLKPAVSVKKSIQNDHIVCLEDGKKFKSLKRHLTANHGLSPDEYRERWNLSRDYPMVAPAYANARSEMAKKMGLGRKPGKAPAKRSRRKAS